MNNTALKKTIFNVMGLVGVAALSNFSQAASFDCAKAAAPIEKLICSDEATSKLYADLAAVYNLGDANHGRHFAEAQVFWFVFGSSECERCRGTVMAAMRDCWRRLVI